MRRLINVIKCSQADWTAFLQAVRDVNLQHIHNAIEKSKKWERERNTVESCLHLLEVVQSLPTAGICTQLSHTSITAPQSPLPAPHFTTTSHTPGNTFMNQTGRQGNLTFVPHPNLQTRTPMSTTQVDALRACLNTLPHHPDDDTGRATYRKQLANWDTKHSSQTCVTEETPYPLRLGTAPICTAECWNHGTNGHRHDACPIPISNEVHISPKEAADEPPHQIRSYTLLFSLFLHFPYIADPPLRTSAPTRPRSRSHDNHTRSIGLISLI